MKSKLLIIFLFAIFFLSGFTFEAIAEEKSGGKIDWSGGYISAVGEGTAKPSGNRVKDELRALRAATVLGQRALLETVKGVKIDSQKNIGNRMAQEDVVNTRIRGTIQGAQIVNKNVRWEGDIPLATVELRICLGGLGACESDRSIVQDLALDQTMEQSNVPSQRLNDITVGSESVPLGSSGDQSSAPTRPVIETGAEKSSPLSVRSDEQPDVPSRKPARVAVKQEKTTPVLQNVIYDSSKPVTGIIFNLQGISFEHVLLPVIITVDDNHNSFTIYSVKSVEPRVVRTHGTVRYADTVDQARENTFLGDNIMVVPVFDVTRENLILIEFRNARIVRETTFHGNDYFKDAKVVIAAQ
ncbi:MAG: hypothetical protein JW902_07470 [Syntrophaceae bacterium]|nr:hypothetical protein [Syntrophaceae bacterium]